MAAPAVAELAGASEELSPAAPASATPEVDAQRLEALPALAGTPSSAPSDARRLPEVLPLSALQPAFEVRAAALLGLAATCIDLAAPRSVSPWWAPWLGAAGCAALCIGTVKRQNLVWRGPALLGLLAPVVAAIAAVGSLLFEGRAAPFSAAVSGSICLAGALSLELLGWRHRDFAPWRAQLEAALTTGGRKLGEADPPRLVRDLKPGEEILLEPSERSPADAVIVAGQAQVEPWLESPLRVLRQEGDALLAGARVLEGKLRAAVRWAGVDRAWARLTIDPNRRADRHTSPARLAERLATTGALALAMAAALTSLSSDRHPALVLSSAAALGAALGGVALPEIISLQIWRGLQQLLAHGVSFRNPAALDRAARTSTVVFCAEGTLVQGELSVASIEPAPPLRSDELLGLIAGAYAGIASPLALAVQRSAQAHQIRPDAIRSPSYTPGLGVTAVASTGQSLVVGNRRLLLERRISVAGAEARIAELEALGRSVLLVALDSRWVGLVALQDAAAAGGRAAVQRLLDAGVEPILLSGEARETCQALARHVGIEHVRPEILPEERADEIRRLSETRPALAVVGRSSSDDASLGAAPLSINIDATGGSLERWDVDIASGDVRDAAWAVQLSRKLHSETRGALVTAAAPAFLALSLLILGLPAWLAPLLGLAGSTLALHRLRPEQRTN